MCEIKNQEQYEQAKKGILNLKRDIKLAKYELKEIKKEIIKYKLRLMYDN